MSDSIAWLTVIGINENGLAGLGDDARAAIAEATLVAGGKRHLELARGLIKGEVLPWPSPPHLAIPAIKAARPKKVCVLASGDPFFYGMGAVLAREIAPHEMRVYPAASIVAQVSSRMGWAAQDVVTVAMNGRPVERLIPHLQPGAKLVMLSADEYTPETVVSLLKERGLGEAKLTVFEHLGGDKECVTISSVADFAMKKIARLNVMALIVPPVAKPCLPLTSGLADDWFEHDGQMTKREVRALTLSALAPRKGELLWDIGLGAGSVAIEWLLADPANRAIGFEKNPERAARAARNAKKLGVPQLVVLEGAAPAVLEGLDAPDAIFIGGGAGEPGMIDMLYNVLKSGGRLVANGVSLETEALLLAAHKRYGGELIRIGVERADAISERMSGWRPAMTVTQWSVTK